MRLPNIKLTILGVLALILTGCTLFPSKSLKPQNLTSSEVLGATVLQVYQGGTGVQTLTLGECLVGNGSGAITTQACGAGGAASGDPGAWQKKPLVNALTPTSTTNGFFVTASSTVEANFRVQGNATTTGSFAVGSVLAVKDSTASTTGSFNIGTSLGGILAVAGVYGAGDLFVGDDATVTGSLSAPEICISSDCQTAWPTSGSSGDPGAWQAVFGTTALQPTSTARGIFVTASSTIDANFRVDGNTTSTGRFVIGTGIPLSIFKSGDLWVKNGVTTTRATTTESLFVGYNAVLPTAGFNFANGDLYVGDDTYLNADATVTQGFYASNGAFTVIDGLTKANDLRPIVVNATTSNAGTLNIWTEGRNTLLHASTAEMATLSINGNTAVLTNGGSIQSAAGTAAVPGHSFVLDTDTGMYDESNDILMFSTNGVLRLRINNTTTDVLMGFHAVGNATTSKWLNVGTTDVVNTFGEGANARIGVGDLYVGADATVTKGFTASAGSFNAIDDNASTTGSLNIGTSLGVISTSLFGVGDLFIGDDATITQHLTLSALTAASATLNSICIDGTTKETFENAASSCVVSSRRYKHDIQPLNVDTWGIMNKLRPVVYRDNSTNQEHIGFIAEEVQTIEPRLVDLDKDGLPQSVRYQEFTAVITKWAQGIMNDINMLFSWNQDLEDKLTKQQQEIEQLKVGDVILKQRFDTLEKSLNELKKSWKN